MYDCCDDDCDCPPSGVTNLESKRGDSLIFQVQVYQPPPASSAPQDMTGWYAQFTAKYQTSDQDSQAVAISKTTGVSPNIITFPNGVRTGLMQIASGPLNTVSFGDGPTRLTYVVKVIDPSGNVTTVQYGTWTVTPTAMRATTPQ